MSYPNELRRIHNVIRRTYTPLFCHPDEITDLKISQLAAAFQRVRMYHMMKWVVQIFKPTGRLGAER